MPIRAVLFDLGGVLTTSPVTRIQAYCEEAVIPYDLVRPILADHAGIWSRFETGAIDDLTFAREFEAALAADGISVDGRAFLLNFFGGMSVREEMVAVARSLRPRYRTAAITNNIQREGQREPSALNWDELFEFVVESSKVGMRKPDPRIYQHACELLAVMPAECVFLDDFGVNLKAARALGMTTIKVDHTLSAVDELEAVLGHELPRLPAGPA